MYISAGIVLAKPNEIDPTQPPHMQCVALGAGCSAPPLKVSTEGTVVYDMHCEVLARRGFMQYLYQVRFCSLNRVMRSCNNLQNVSLACDKSELMQQMSIFETDSNSQLKLRVSS